LEDVIVLGPDLLHPLLAHPPTEALRAVWCLCQVYWSPDSEEVRRIPGSQLPLLMEMSRASKWKIHSEKLKKNFPWRWVPSPTDRLGSDL
jgi:hypothetical protein